MSNKRRWSMRLEGLSIYNMLLIFFWRDWNIWTAVWLFVPFMAVTVISSIGEEYRKHLPPEDKE